MDGDGELEILMKFTNQQEGEQLYPKNGPTIDGVETKEYSMLACLTVILRKECMQENDFDGSASESFYGSICFFRSYQG